MDSETPHSLEQEVKRLEAALEQSQTRLSRLEALLDVADIPVFEWDVGGGGTPWWNAAQYRLVGLEPGAAEPSPLLFEAVVHPDDLESAREALIQALQSGRDRYQVEVRIRRSDGWRRYIAHGRVERDAQGAPQRVLGYLEDVTYVRLLEAAQHREVRLAHAGLLASAVAHDLNNLLTVVLGSLALADLGEDDQAEALEVAADATRRGGILTTQLTAFVRQREMQENFVDLGAVLTRVGSWARHIVGAAISTTVNSIEGCEVRVDPVRLEQVLLNLCINARDAMPDGGTLELGACWLGEAEVELWVKDTGIGMSDALAARVFEPFVSTKQAQGTGLGLAGVEQLVTQMQGTIAVETAEAEGSTFRITLPARRAEIEAAGTASGVAAPGGQAVLFIEEDGLIRHLYGRLLVHAGYDVNLVASVAEALALGGDLSNVDVVVAPSPGADDDWPAAIARLWPSAVRLPVDGPDGGEDGGSGLAKPFGPAELIAAVQRVLDERG